MFTKMYLSVVVRIALIFVLVAGLAGVTSVRAMEDHSPLMLPGTTWYVTTTGSDANSCLAPASPCATIKGAIDKAAAGDVVKVASGTYVGRVSTDKSIQLLGGWNNSFTVQNGRSIIDGQYTETGVSVASMDPFITVEMKKFIIQRSAGSGMTVSNAILTLSDMTIRDNRTPGYAGGIYASINNKIVLNNVTITGNFAGRYAGGIYSYAETNTITINNSTIANNFAGLEGGGFFIENGVITIQNSILANNKAGHAADCLGTIDTSQHNIIGEFTGCAITTGTGNQTNVDPLIGSFPIGSFGYHALQPDSPAINAGQPATCLSTDVRGVARPQGGVCDIGAYEYVSPGSGSLFGIISGTPQKTAPSTSFRAPFAVYVTDAQGSPVSGAEVNFTAPGSGASGTFASSGTNTASASTDAAGIVIASAFTANTQQGNYQITATINGLPGSLSFALTNAGWYVSPAGSDANPCTTPTSSCATINRAIEKASDGDTILVAAGTYISADNFAPVVSVAKDVAVFGGWNAAFTVQNGDSVIDGQSTKTGMDVGPTTLPGYLFNPMVDHFIIQNGSGGLSAGYSNLTIKHSVIRNNTAWSDGGGINAYDSNLVISDSMISGNNSTFQSANGGGIALRSASSLTIQNATISDNAAYRGGGLSLDIGVAATLTNVTLSGNQAWVGGGLSNSSYGHVNFNNVTVTNNVATSNFQDSGGGIINSQTGQFILENSLIAGNVSNSAPDCLGSFTSKGHNLIGSRKGCTITATTGDQIGEASAPINAKLGNLLDNGGLTLTHALLNGSPAIDAGNPSTCANTDQRGVARPQGAACDIGAYEAETETTSPAVTSIVRADGNHTVALTVNFTVIFSKPVTDVDANDFILNTTGSITGTSIGNVTGTGPIRTVMVNTGSGNGTLGLTVPTSATISDEAGNPITGLPYTSGETYMILKTATFEDVNTDYWAGLFIERLYSAGITGGCNTNPLQYCPEGTVTRAQMAVFLLRGIHTSSYAPPAIGAGSGFGDVPVDYWSGAWIKQLAAEGITTGCGNGNFCPEHPVTRAQMAVFLMRSKHGTSYSPPGVGAGTGFGDVPPDYWAATWIKQLVTEGITTGCGNGNYCPENPVTRAQMAVFLVKTFDLP